MPRTNEPAPNRVRWTRQQADAIREAGVLTGRYELIDGEIISHMGQKPAHAFVVRALLAWLTRVFGAEHVLIQSTIRVGDADSTFNEPEPDAAVTAEPFTAYDRRHPGPADLLLLVEVSDTTLRFDQTTKAALYARSGVAEYWVIDLNGRQLFAYRRPSADGYAEVVAYGESESLSPLARPDAPVNVADLLPPLPEE